MNGSAEEKQFRAEDLFFFYSPYSPNMSNVHCLYSTSLDTNFTASQMTSIPNVASSRKFIRYLWSNRKITFSVRRPDGLTSSYHDYFFADGYNSQGAWVLFGECGQENVGEVDEKSTNGLLGCVEKPGKDSKECVKKKIFYESDFFKMSF